MPQYTNKKQLSASWLKAAKTSNEEYNKVGWHSVTTLIDSPRAKLLAERHDSEISVDISDSIFQILGSAVHKILELSAEPNVITEQRIIFPVLRKEVSMKADRIEPVPGTLPRQYIGKDYKITKVWAWRYGAKPAQIAQANCYRFGYSREMKLDIRAWYLEMLLRDWSPLEAKKGGEQYPDAEVMSVQVPLWDLPMTARYLKDRVKLFMECEDLADDDLPECNPEETWQRPDSWAFQKRGAARASRVLSTKEEADAMLAGKSGTHEVVFRPGSCPRCEEYCNAKKFCNQWKRYAGIKEEKTEEEAF